MSYKSARKSSVNTSRRPAHHPNKTRRPMAETVQYRPLPHRQDPKGLCAARAVATRHQVSSITCPIREDTECLPHLPITTWVLASLCLRAPCKSSTNSAATSVNATNSGREQIFTSQEVIVKVSIVFGSKSKSLLKNMVFKKIF